MNWWVALAKGGTNINFTVGNPATCNSPSTEDINFNRYDGVSALRRQVENAVESNRLLRNKVEDFENSLELGAQAK